MPWLAGENVIQLNYHLKEEESEDVDIEVPRAEGALSNTAARQLNKEQLIAQLVTRKASTVGVKATLLERLLGLLDRENENKFTHADRDVMDGRHHVTVQMDNAKPHIGYDNVANLNEFAKDHGFVVNVTLQPPRSPDLNKLDMSVFRSLAARASNYKVQSNNLNELACNVVREYEDYPIDYLLRTHAQTFAVYREILRHDGGIDYPSPHGEIRKHQKEGSEIVDLYVDVTLVQKAEKWLVDNQLS